MEAHKVLLNIGVWVLFVQGVICIGVAMTLFMTGKPVTEFAVHGVVGAGGITLAAVVAVLRRQLQRAV